MPLTYHTTMRGGQTRKTFTWSNNPAEDVDLTAYMAAELGPMWQDITVDRSGPAPALVWQVYASSGSWVGGQYVVTWTPTGTFDSEPLPTTDAVLLAKVPIAPSS